MIQEHDLLRCAKKLFPAAALSLGSLTEGRSAVTEAIAAAIRKQPDAWESEAIRQLIRICRTRAPERIEQNALPQDAALKPLLPVCKLPSGSRRALALAISGIPAQEVAEASGITAEEYAQKTEKALRQLTFMQNGTAPALTDLQTAANAFPWHETDSEMLLSGIAAAEAPEEPEQHSPAIREIRRTASQKSAHGRTVSVPLWGIVLSILCVLALAAALLYLLSSAPKLPARQQEPEEPYTAAVSSILSDKYLPIGEIQKIAAGDAGSDSSACFLSTKLKPDETPPCYVVSFITGRKIQYDYILDASSGEILDKSHSDAADIPNTANWLPAEEIRQAALSRTGLHDVIILKEKRTSDGDTGYYKFEVLDSEGSLYTIQIDAHTAMLLKYTAEELAAEEPDSVISPEQAKQRALSRVGDLVMSQVIFTKCKQDGDVYLIAFTLDDGTQYLIELNAANGNINTVDVHPVSADITQAIGLLAARDTALHMAELTERDPVEFTKAKIDRGTAAYVYELSFKTPDYEYEATVATATGEVLYFRAWHQ